MARLPVDYDDIPDTGTIEAVPVGLYNVIIRKAEETESSNSNPMISLELEIEGGDYNGRLLFDHAVLTTKALWKIKSIGSATGVKGEGDFFPHNELVNKRCRVKVKHEQYEGEPRAKVDRYEKLSTEDDLPEIDINDDEF